MEEFDVQQPVKWKISQGSLWRNQQKPLSLALTVNPDWSLVTTGLTGAIEYIHKRLIRESGARKTVN